MATNPEFLDIRQTRIPILFVNKSHYDDKRDPLVNELFCFKLEPDFKAYFIPIFGGHILEQIDNNLAGRDSKKYRALVTHFPYDEGYPGAFCEFKGMEFYEKAYATSSCLIRKLKSSHPDFPVILYTGLFVQLGPQEPDPNEEVVEKFFAALGIDGFVFKGSNLQEDANEVKRKLHVILG